TARTVVAAPAPPRPRSGSWAISGDAVRSGSLTFAADRRRIVTLRATPRADVVARCGRSALALRRGVVVAVRSVAGRPLRLLGRADRRSSDGISPVAVTLTRDGRPVPGRLALVVDGPSEAHGRLVVGGCELPFRARRR
ncbi:hypothetical protein, partial [Patulibacter medicamentivorans]|uniref:hypothetical protein n=1 Tax=Patulibacter medicamentivorans TaxID=1097667 RepID=UPI001B8B0524